MTNRLKKAEYLSYAENLEVGEQTHVNHQDCEAGTDTKRRLYVRRTDHGVVAYCHHCGKSGSYRENERRYRSLEDTLNGTGTASTRHLTLPRDSESDPRKWPAKAKVWLYQYRITDEEIRRYGIVYSDSVGRVILPVYSSGSMVGYQARRIYEDGSEKYITKTIDPRRMVWYTSNTTSTDVVVFCEDILSAIRCARFTSSCALLGTYLKDEVLSRIVEDHSKFMIFLDDDNRQVILNQIALKNKLELFGEVKLITGIGKDPKECSDDELMEILL